MFDFGRDYCSFCVDRMGNDKRLYPSRRDADRAVDMGWIERRIQLRVYRCPHGGGFHLTRSP